MSNREKVIWGTVIAVNLFIAALVVVAFLFNAWLGTLVLLATLWPIAKKDAIGIIEKTREGAE